MSISDSLQVGVLEARNRFSELLRRAAQGEAVVITRHGRPFVRMNAARPVRTSAEIESLIARGKRLRAKVEVVSTWAENKRDRDEGRRF